MHEGAFGVSRRAESSGVRGYAEGVVIMLVVRQGLDIVEFFW